MITVSRHCSNGFLVLVDESLPSGALLRPVDLTHGGRRNWRNWRGKCQSGDEGEVPRARLSADDAEGTEGDD